MKFQWIDTHREAFDVTVMCQVLDVSRSGYYAWQERPPAAASPQPVRNSSGSLTQIMTGSVTSCSGRGLRLVEGPGQMFEGPDGRPAVMAEP